MPITAAIVNATAQAVLQAYNDYGNGDIAAPDGYANSGTSFYGWEGLDPALPATAKKFALVFRSNQTPGLFLVAFRGTDTPDEWIADATFPTSTFPNAVGIEVASGFLDVYTRNVVGQIPISLRDQLFQYLKSVQVSQLIVTGHSLGSALAALFAFDVATNLKIQPAVVTYACPHVGKAAWAAAFEAAVPNATRIYNDQDIVPYLPPATMGYAPVGAAWTLKFCPQGLDRVLPKALETNHSMDNYEYVAGHAVANTPQTWISSFPDQSADTSWAMQSEAPAAVGTPLGLTMAAAHLDFLRKLRDIHGLSIKL